MRSWQNDLRGASAVAVGLGDDEWLGWWLGVPSGKVDSCKLGKFKGRVVRDRPVKAASVSFHHFSYRPVGVI